MAPVGAFMANGLMLMASTVGDEFMVNTSTQNLSRVSKGAALSDGGFVITWQGNEENRLDYSLYGQLFDSAGTASGRAV